MLNNLTFHVVSICKNHQIDNSENHQANISSDSRRFSGKFKGGDGGRRGEGGVIGGAGGDGAPGVNFEERSPKILPDDASGRMQSSSDTIHIKVSTESLSKLASKLISKFKLAKPSEIVDPDVLLNQVANENVNSSGASMGHLEAHKISTLCLHHADDVLDQLIILRKYRRSHFWECQAPNCFSIWFATKDRCREHVREHFCIYWCAICKLTSTTQHDAQVQEEMGIDMEMILWSSARAVFHPGARFLA